MGALSESEMERTNYAKDKGVNFILLILGGFLW